MTDEARRLLECLYPDRPERAEAGARLIRQLVCPDRPLSLCAVLAEARRVAEQTDAGALA